MYGYTSLNKRRLSKVFKESRHWDKDAHSHQQTWTQSELPNFRAHAAQICQLFFPQERKEERANQNCLLPRLPKTGRSPALQLQTVADLTPALTRPGYFSRTVSIKQSGNHVLLGTSRWNPVACPHIKLSHHFGGLLLKKVPTICVLQVQVHQHTEPALRQGSAVDPCSSTVHLTAHRLCPSTKTHSWLHVKQHTPQIL